MPPDDAPAEDDETLTPSPRSVVPNSNSPNSPTKPKDGNEKVIAMAKLIVKSLGPSKKNKQDMIGFLSNITDFLSIENETIVEIQSAEKKIHRWKSSQRHHHHRISFSDEDEFLSDVDQILELMDNSVLLPEGEFTDRVDTVVEIAMKRLKDEFHNILISSNIPYDDERLSVGSLRRVSLSSDDNNGSEEFGYESCEEDFCVETVKLDGVVLLKKIADRMIRGGYDKECCYVYSSVRHDILVKCVTKLGFDKLSSKKEVEKIEWGALDEKMKRWIRAIQVVSRVVLVGEKQLCGRIFGGGSERILDVCFVESAKGCVLQLLEFAEAIVVGKRAPEKLFRILDMYDTLADVLLDFKALFGAGSFVCSKVQRVLAGLGEAAKGMFAEFEKAVQGETSRKPTQGAEIHPLVRYVMNYLKLVVDYSDSLNSIMGIITDNSCQDEGDSGDPFQLGSSFQLGPRIISLISSLESNLETKSKLYEDGGMQYVFMMNNILYIVQKVKDSELGKLLGDNWVRRHRCQIRQNATCYLRVSWSKVLSSLKEEGLGGSGSSSNVSKSALKERFKSFNTAFEEIYRKQTTWKVVDVQLREELRISISEMVFPAYRSFLGRFRGHLENERHVYKYIKYTPEDLEKHLSCLFEGSPRVLHNPKRK